MKMSQLTCVLCLTALAAQAQDPNEIEQIRKQMKEATDAFQKAAEQFQKTTDALKKRLDRLQGTNTTAIPVPAETKEPPAQTEAGQGTQGAPPWSPSQPIRVAGNAQNYLNLSFDALFAAGWSTEHDVESLQLGGHDPKQRGFTVQNLEMTLEGQIDPYFRGQAAIVFQIDPNGETAVEAEEAYLETMSLPANLQLRAGQYLTEFGRLNPTHPHTWDFVDQPLVNGRFFGEDGLRNPGARLSWLVPTPFYSELFLSVQNSQGETASSFRSDHDGDLLFGRPATATQVKGLGDLLYAPRYAVSFDVNDENTIVLGASAALGPNSSGRNTDTQIAGGDLFYKWKPRTQSKGWPFLTWQTEGMYRRYEAGRFAGTVDNSAQPSEILRDWGIYSQVSYGFHHGWVGSLRGDFVTGERGVFDPDPDRDERWRISPALTYYPTEFSKVRLQYNVDHRREEGLDHSIWLQVEFLLGSHAAHKF